jgi:hypothetical protein
MRPALDPIFHQINHLIIVSLLLSDSPRLLQVEALLSAILRIDALQVPGYEALDVSKTLSVLFERVLRELDVPCPDDPRLRLHRSQTVRSSASPSSPLPTFAKRLFEDDSNDAALS